MGSTMSPYERLMMMMLKLIPTGWDPVNIKWQFRYRYRMLLGKKIWGKPDKRGWPPASDDSTGKLSCLRRWEQQLIQAVTFWYHFGNKWRCCFGTDKGTFVSLLVRALDCQSGNCGLHCNVSLWSASNMYTIRALANKECSPSSTGNVKPERGKK